MHEAVAGIQQALLWGLDVEDCRSLAIDALLELTASAWGAVAHVDVTRARAAAELVMECERWQGGASASLSTADDRGDDLVSLARPHVLRAAVHRSAVVASVPALLDRLLILPIPGGPGLPSFVLLARTGIGYSEATATGLEPLLRLTGQVDSLSREIEARRATERELERERRRLGLALGASDVGVFEFDATTGALEWDARVWAMHGLAPREDAWTPGDWARSLHPDDGTRVIADLMASVVHSRPLHVEYRVLRGEGDVGHIRSTAQVFEHEGGQRVVVGVSIDVTADVRLQQELAAGRAQAEAATRAKSQFLAVMSHEIRTPMSGVLGMLDLLLQSGLTPEQQEQAATAHASAECLLHLLNDILDLSKLESRHLSIESVPFQPERVIADTMALLAPRAAEKALSLESDVDAAVPAWITGDPLRLRQVLLNLAGNAIKFTAEGRVTLRAYLERSDSAIPRLRVEVRDTGEGIAHEAQGRLFQQFVQADSSTARRFGGSGLGLAISRQLVELMGGRMGVWSEPGLGSTFWFEMPAAATEPPMDLAETPASPAAVHACRSPLRILVVDDNPVNRRLVGAFLSPGRHQVHAVQSGGEALEALTWAAFDLVLLDIQMPVMDGPTCLGRIRALAGAARHVPVLALTANAMAGDRERYLAIGFDEYVSKPFTTRSLLEAMGRAMAARTRRS